MAAYLDTNVFAQAESILMEPEEAGVKEFENFMIRYKNGLPIEKAAVENL